MRKIGDISPKFQLVSDKYLASRLAVGKPYAYLTNAYDFVGVNRCEALVIGIADGTTEVEQHIVCNVLEIFDEVLL